MDKIKDSIRLKKEKLKDLSEDKNFRIDNEILQECGLKNISLRPYQVEGVKWLASRFKIGLGCILADEMGLGKTCQAISLLTYLYSQKFLDKPSMILLPLSVIHNWKDELGRFSPNLNYLLYTGNKDERDKLRNSSNYKNKDFIVLVTTYEICLKDQPHLMKQDWSMMIVDEAHRLKNSQSMLYTALVEFQIDHWLLLTGTPIQNNLKELYSLLSLSSRSIFKSEYLQSFLDYYSDITSSDSDNDIQTILEHVMLRRVKSQVIFDLPSKSEVILYHGLTPLQSKIYKAILAKDIDVFYNEHNNKKTRLMNILMQLRKCVCHPYLFNGVEPEPFVMGEHLVEASGKLLLLDKLLNHLKLKGHKVLLFSQMTSNLDIIQDYMTFRKYSYERLDGSVRSEERHMAISNFNKNEDTFAFLLSTRAGGQGLNLTSADTVIFLDSDFNPQNDLQAAARAHRIGQKRNVKVIRLIGRHSVEEIILKRAGKKLELTSAVMATKSSNGDEGSIKLDDIIKFGLDKLFKEDQVFDVNFEEILGETSNSEWIDPVENVIQKSKSDISSLMIKGTLESEGTTGNMYIFEGKDYSAVKMCDHYGDDDDVITGPSQASHQAFEEMFKRVSVSTSSSPEKKGRSTRRNRKLSGFELLDEIRQKKPRKPLTAEQLEERKKKRQERAEQLAKEEELQKLKISERRKIKKQKLWADNNYVSSKLETLSSSDNSSDSGDYLGTDDDSSSGSSNSSHSSSRGGGSSSSSSGNDTYDDDNGVSVCHSGDDNDDGSGHDKIDKVCENIASTSKLNYIQSVKAHAVSDSDDDDDGGNNIRIDDNEKTDVDKENTDDYHIDEVDSDVNRQSIVSEKMIGDNISSSDAEPGVDDDDALEDEMIMKKNQSSNVLLSSDDDDDDDDNGLIGDKNNKVNQVNKKKKKRGTGIKKINFKRITNIDDNDDDGDDSTSRHLHYVVGDVTNPNKSNQNGSDDHNLVIVVHCVDNSGKWGKGGLFTSINLRTLVPSHKYELAGEMKDLNLGDVHIFPFKKDEDDEEEDEKKSLEQLALLVVQSRDRNNRLTAISTKKLQITFQKLSKYASRKKASLHFPRIGHNSPSFDWYATERMIKKYFVSKKLDTFIYYFPRNKSAVTSKRKLEEAGSLSSASSSKKQALSRSVMQSTTLKDKITSKLPDFMTGICIYFYPQSVGESNEIKKLSRYIIAYNGEIHEYLQKDTTHIILMDRSKVYELVKDTEAKIVTPEWLMDTVRNQNIKDECGYIVNPRVI